MSTKIFHSLFGAVLVVNIVIFVVRDMQWNARSNVLETQLNEHVDRTTELEEQLTKLQVIHEYDTRRASMTSRIQQAITLTLAERNPNSKLVEQPTPRQIVLMATSIAEFSDVYDLEPELILAVIRQESAFDPNAKSKAGAMGLMQLMPMTALGVSIEIGLGTKFKITDVVTNIRFGCYYLKKMKIMFPGDIRLALAAYNAGPIYMAKQIAKAKDPNQKIQYDKLWPETADYVMNIPDHIKTYKEFLWSPRK